MNYNYNYIYVKVAAYTQQGDGVKTEKLICTTAQDGERHYLVE